MNPRTSDGIYRELGEVMANTFPDRDFDLSIGSSTRVFADLGLASIDLIVLGERLELYYGKKLPYGSFLADLRNRGVDDLELGILVNFLLKHIG